MIIKKCNSLFNNLKPTNNFLGFKDNTPNLFSFNNNQNKNISLFESSNNSCLFSNNNEKAQGKSLFGEKNIEGNKPLFGNSSQNPLTNTFSSDTNIIKSENSLFKPLFNNNTAIKEDKDNKKETGLFGNHNQNLFSEKDKKYL